MSIHVLKATSAPTTVPTRSGVHYIDTLAKKHYFSVGTATVADWVEIGSGSGGGTTGGDAGINHILRGSADTGIDGWNLYKDAAGALPVDATQGGNLASITFTQNTTSPLRGTADFRFTKPASNVQGEGVSYDFTIPRADLAKVQTISFEYEVVSGTFATGDLTVYIIQDTTGTPVVIQPSAFRIEAVGGTTKGRFIGVFQTHASVLNYRLAFHVASTSALAYTLGIDRISVGPQTVQYGAAVTEWKDFPSVAAGTLITATTTSPTYGTVTVNKAQWRQVGTDMEIRWDYAQTTAGTAGSGTYLFNLPAGYSIDTTKVSVSASADLSKSLGRFDYQDGVAVGTGYVIAHSATQLRMVMQVNNGTAAYSTGTVSSVYGQLNLPTVTYSIRATVPIQGFGGTVQFSNDADTRVVAAKAHASVAQAISSSTTLAFGTVVGDTHGGFTSSTTYTVQVPGWYRATANLTFGAVATSAINININKNGTSFAFGASPNTALTFGFAQANGKTYCNAGDTITVTASQNSAAANYLPGLALTYLDLERISGPSAIAASENIALAVGSSSGQVIPSGVETTILYNAIKKDSHGSYNSATGIWTCSTPGFYYFFSAASFLSAASDTNSWTLAIQRNGTTIYYQTVNKQTSAFAAIVALVTGGGEQLLVGDQIRVRASQDTGTGRGLSSNPANVHLTIFKVGL